MLLEKLALYKLIHLAGAGGLKSDGLDLGTGAVYGSDELATLLGDDWFQHDCAMPATPICSHSAAQYIVCNVTFFQVFSLSSVCFACFVLSFCVVTVFIDSRITGWIYCLVRHP